MDNDKFSGLEPEKPKITKEIDDPYAQSEEDLKSRAKLKKLANEQKEFFIKFAPKAALIFLGIVFIVFLPFSVMNLEFENFWQFLQNYSIAFVDAVGMVLVTSLTIAAPYLAKYLYKLIKEIR